MSANVESMFYAGREKPWHGLGTQVEEAPTSADALRLAGLDWNIVRDEQSQPARVENVDLMQQCSIVFSAKNTQIHYLFRVVVIPNLINAAKLLSVFFQRCFQMSKYWF